MLLHSKKPGIKGERGLSKTTPAWAFAHFEGEDGGESVLYRKKKESGLLFTESRNRGQKRDVHGSKASRGGSLLRCKNTCSSTG